MFILYRLFRKFIQKVPDASNYRSTIMSKLGEDIDEFKKLTDKNLDWSVHSKVIEEREDLPIKDYRE